ncbi:AAA domain protein [anaerobic digester metagenome]
MIILITGTPGTGKSTVSKILHEKLLSKSFQSILIPVNDLIYEKHLYNGVDDEKGYKVVDIDDLCNELGQLLEDSQDPLDSRVWIVEGHLSHYFQDADFVVVLRAKPQILRERLKTRNWKDSKIKENSDAEALAVCTCEAYQIHGERVNEIDTTNISPEETAEIIIEVMNDKKHFPAGTVDFIQDITLD